MSCADARGRSAATDATGPWGQTSCVQHLVRRRNEPILDSTKRTHVCELTPAWAELARHMGKHSVVEPCGADRKGLRMLSSIAAPSSLRVRRPPGRTLAVRMPALRLRIATDITTLQQRLPDGSPHVADHNCNIGSSTMRGRIVYLHLHVVPHPKAALRILDQK